MSMKNQFIFFVINIIFLSFNIIFIYIEKNKKMINIVV